MAREALVDECVVRVQKVHDAAIFAYRAPDEQLRLTLEPLDQAQVVIRITVLIDHNFLDATQVQPLTCKVIQDRKSTRLNSSHLGISYAVFCLKKKIGGHPEVRQPVRHPGSI